MVILSSFQGTGVEKLSIPVPQLQPFAPRFFTSKEVPRDVERFPALF